MDKDNRGYLLNKIFLISLKKINKDSNSKMKKKISNINKNTFNSMRALEQ